MDKEVHPGTGLKGNAVQAVTKGKEPDTVMEDVSRKWEVLLVEDNPADIRLTREAFKDLNIRHNLQVAEDGMAALHYLKNICSGLAGVCPDIILLDLNLPKLGGLEVLAAIKSDANMKSIPVIVMSSSASEADISAAYRLNANSYTQKPLEIDQFFRMIDNIRRFWMETALLPEVPAGKPH